jgi:hypothetical protein
MDHRSFISGASKVRAVTGQSLVSTNQQLLRLCLIQTTLANLRSRAFSSLFIHLRAVMGQTLSWVPMSFWQQDVALHDTSNATPQATQADDEGRRQPTKWADSIRPSDPANDLQGRQDQAQQTDAGAESAHQVRVINHLPKGIYESDGDPSESPRPILYVYTAQGKTTDSSWNTIQCWSFGLYISQDDAENRVRAAAQSAQFAGLMRYGYPACSTDWIRRFAQFGLLRLTSRPTQSGSDRMILWVSRDVVNLSSSGPAA